jgi:hypothetical protein
MGKKTIILIAILFLAFAALAAEKGFVGPNGTAVAGDAPQPLHGRSAGQTQGQPAR